MTERSLRILDEIRNLPDSERNGLLDALHEEYEPVYENEAQDEETKAEINRRIARLDAGEKKFYSWQEVREHMRASVS